MRLSSRISSLGWVSMKACTLALEAVGLVGGGAWDYGDPVISLTLNTVEQEHRIFV